jgi:type II secretory pathway pseudopilin PulG
MENKHQSKRAFSMLEIAVVLAFLVVLAAISTPNAAF